MLVAVIAVAVPVAIALLVVYLLFRVVLLVTLGLPVMLARALGRGGTRAPRSAQVRAGSAGASNVGSDPVDDGQGRRNVRVRRP